MVRTNRLAWLVGTYVGYEAVFHTPKLKALAPGWRLLSVLGVAWFAKSAVMSFYAPYMAPVMGAYLRKYSDSAKVDPFDIKDPKKEYFYIDTS